MHKERQMPDAMTKIADEHSEYMNQEAWWYVVRVLLCERHQQDSVVNCEEGYTVKNSPETKAGCVKREPQGVDVEVSSRDGQV